MKKQIIIAIACMAAVLTFTGAAVYFLFSFLIGWVRSARAGPFDILCKR